MEAALGEKYRKGFHEGGLFSGYLKSLSGTTVFSSWEAHFSRGNERRQEASWQVKGVSGTGLAGVRGRHFFSYQGEGAIIVES